MAALQLPFASYQRFTGAITRLVNAYAEEGRTDSKGPILLNRIPGISLLTTVGTSGCRGAILWNEKLYAVIGSTLYEISSLNVATSIGTIAGTSRVSMAAGSQLGIVNEIGTGYTYDGTTLSTITDGDFPSVATSGATMLDDYMVVFTKGSNQFNASDNGDFTSWDALSFDKAQGSDDAILGVIAGQSRLYVGGEDTTEIWWNAGLSPFPLQRIPNGVIDLGLTAQHTQAIIDNSMCWWAHDGTVRILRGLTPQRISTHAVEARLASYENKSNAYALSMSRRGHSWYVLTVPDEGTWVYDFNIGEWHERESLGFDSWNVEAYARAYNRDYAFFAAKVGEIDEATHDEFGTEIQAQWTYPAVYGGGRRIRHKRFELRASVGVGNASVPTPQITLYLSDDGGKTFQAMPVRSMGKVGKYRTSVMWTRLGSSEDRVYRCAMADPAQLHIWGTEVDAEGGMIMGDR